jgi:hypothetical protein
VDALVRRCDDPTMRRWVGLVAVAAVVAGTALAVIVVARLVDSDSTSAGAATTSFPQGVYRYHLTKQDVLDVVPDIGPDYLADAVGTFTWTLRDGVITLAQTDCKCTIPGVRGSYTVAGDRLTVRWPLKATNGVEFCTGKCTETVRWRYDGKALHIEPISPQGYDIVFWGAYKPWRHING